MALEDRTADVVARRLAALGEPTRLKLVMALREREDASVHELAEAVGGTLPNVSKHLQVLYQAGLITRRKDGNFVRYQVAGDAVATLVAYSVRILGAGVRPTEPRRFPKG